MGKKVHYLTSCPSTNSVAAQLLSEGPVAEGSIVYTADQTAGRGQRGNSWETQQDKNLTLSYILKPSFLEVKRQFHLNVAVSLALYDLIGETVGMFPKVKWPNDMYIGGNKVAGILIENFLQGRYINHSIIGIGLNVNQQEFETPNAVSMSQVSGKHYQLNVLVDALSECLERRYLQLRNGQYEQMRMEYLQAMFWYQEERPFAELTAEGELTDSFEGEILGVDADGRLGIMGPEGLKYYGFKEVKFLV